MRILTGGFARSCVCMMLIGAVLLGFEACAWAVFSGLNVKKGNKLYGTGEYSEALEKYKKVLKSKPDSDIVNFDAGSAFYKLEKYEEAEKAFSRSLVTEDKKLEAKAVYNMGCTKYKQGSLVEEINPSASIPFYQQAGDYFERAVELDETDEDAKVNLEIVKKKLKKLSNMKSGKKKQAEQDNGEEGDEAGEGSEGQGEKDERSRVSDEGNSSEDDRFSENDKERGKEDPVSEKKEEADKEMARDGASDEPSREGKDAGKDFMGDKGREYDKMSEKEARMLLEAFKQDENSKGDVLIRRPKGAISGAYKNW